MNFTDFTFTVSLSFAPRCQVVTYHFSIQLSRSCQQPQIWQPSPLCPRHAGYCSLLCVVFMCARQECPFMSYINQLPPSPINTAGSLSGHVSKTSGTILFDKSTAVPGRVFQTQRGNWYKFTVPKSQKRGKTGMCPFSRSNLSQTFLDLRPWTTGKLESEPFQCLHFLKCFVIFLRCNFPYGFFSNPFFATTQMAGCTLIQGQTK